MGNEFYRCDTLNIEISREVNGNIGCLHAAQIVLHVFEILLQCAEVFRIYGLIKIFTELYKTFRSDLVFMEAGCKLLGYVSKNYQFSDVFQKVIEIDLISPHLLIASAVVFECHDVVGAIAYLIAQFFIADQVLNDAASESYVIRFGRYLREYLHYVLTVFLHGTCGSNDIF